MVCCMALLSTAAESSFTDRGGVRPLGMGGAFVALADDASAIMFNPAGLGQIEKAELATAYDKLYAGLGDDSLGRGLISYVYPSPLYGAFAVNAAILHAPMYDETTVTLGYGKAFGQLYLGVNAKGLFASLEKNEYTKNDPLFNTGMSANGVAIDMGILWKASDILSFGIAALNVNQPDMSFSGDGASRVPLMLQTGIALKLGSAVPAVDLTYINKEISGKRDVNLHFGLESWLADESVALRCGVNLYDMSVGASYVFGQGNDTDAQLDYAFRYPLSFRENAVRDIYGTHQFSLNVRFASFANDAQQETALQDAAIDDARIVAAKLMMKAMTYKKERQYDKAVALCNEILNMEFSGSEIYRLKAKLEIGSMMAKLQRYDEAISVLESAVKMAADNPMTHYSLGLVYAVYGDMTENVSWYNKAKIELERTRLIDSTFKDVVERLNALNKKR